MASDSRAGRSNISPSSLGPSLTVYSAAMAFTVFLSSSGPPGSARLRKRMYFSEWQAEQTSL